MNCDTPINHKDGIATIRAMSGWPMRPAFHLYAAEGFGLEFDGRLRVKTKNDGHRTQVPGIYTAGDMRRGQFLVVWAIREGRNAAREVDEDLMGYSNLGAAE